MAAVAPTVPRLTVPAPEAPPLVAPVPAPLVAAAPESEQKPELESDPASGPGHPVVAIVPAPVVPAVPRLVEPAPEMPPLTPPLSSSGS